MKVKSRVAPLHFKVLHEKYTVFRINEAKVKFTKFLIIFGISKRLDYIVWVLAKLTCKFNMQYLETCDT